MRNNPQWREGYAAYESGVLYQQCPYERMTDKGSAWEAGWFDASCDDMAYGG